MSGHFLPCGMMSRGGSRQTQGPDKKNRRDWGDPAGLAGNKEKESAAVQSRWGVGGVRNSAGGGGLVRSVQPMKKGGGC